MSKLLAFLKSKVWPLVILALGAGGAGGYVFQQPAPVLLDQTRMAAVTECQARGLDAYVSSAGVVTCSDVTK
jgi:hypothetical protein